MLQEGQELPGPSIGDGPPWILRKASINACGEVCTSEKFEQALSCSDLADVGFVFDDGESLLRGHWAILCKVCDVFRGMQENRMEEETINQVRIVGTSRESFRGFLEWLYFGRAGNEMARADGREVWLLADRYQVEGIREWLTTECLYDEKTVCAALQYALKGDGEGRDELLEACRLKGLEWVSDTTNGEDLRGVSACAVCEVLKEHSRISGGTYVLGIARYRFFERWARANGVNESMYCEGGSAAEMHQVLQAVNLFHLPLDFLQDVVMPSSFVSAEAVGAVIEQRLGEEVGGIGDARYQVARTHDIGEFQQVMCIALSRHWEEQRIAVVDHCQDSVHVFSVGSGARFPRVGWEHHTSPGWFCSPTSAAFTKRGELIVSDSHNHSLHVFDHEAVYLRSFGGKGGQDGEVERPGGIAVDHEGNVIVCDQGNNRVQIFREDGTFLRMFGVQGSEHGQLSGPANVAVGLDGRIVVVDAPEGRSRVQVFDHSGNYVMMIVPRGEGASNRSPNVAVGARGEILVSDQEGGHVQVFDAGGLYVQTIGGEGGSGYGTARMKGIAVDGQGHIFGVEVDEKNHHAARIVMLAKAED